ncbi:MAG: GNAT family protein [Chloroflexi bacterium]|nr:GNAT family protein [Chloroflexota bacterium]
MFFHQLDDDTDLHLLEERHADELLVAIETNREHLLPWLPWVSNVNNVNDSKRYIAGTLQQFADGNGMAVGIRYQGDLAGVVNLHFVDRYSRRTSIGYWLCQEFQGQGLITKTCARLVDHSFGALELNRVEIRCASENTRSRAIPARLGFEEEGTLRQAELVGDKLMDHVIYGLLAHDWAGSQSFGVQ